MTTRCHTPNDRVIPPRIVGTGLLALDVLLDETRAGSRAELGGSAGNVLAILAFLGWSSVPVARLGADVAGTRIRREFEFLHADTRFIKYETHTRTPVVYQWPGDEHHTHKFSFSCPFCGQKRGFAPAEADVNHCHAVLSLVERPDVFYFDRVTEWSLHLAENYRKRGALVVFEPSALNVDPVAFQRAINACTVIKYADERIDELEEYDCSGVEVAIQTLGAEGLRFKISKEARTNWHRLPAFSVPQVVDTAGAGDWCTAGLLYSLHKSGSSKTLTETSLSRSLRFGQVLAALNCMYAGARGLAKNGVRTRLEELSYLVERRSRESLTTTSEWKRFFDPAVLSGLTREPDSFMRGSVEPARLCCEPLGF